MNISSDLSSQVLDNFFKITKKDIRATFLRYSFFMQEDYKSISDFFQGKSKTVSSQPFKNLKKLKLEIKETLSIFDNSSVNLNNIQFVDLLEAIEQINDALNNISNISKWSRSSLDLFGYNSNFKLEYALSQFDSLEKISNNILSSNNPQDDWYSIAVENNLEEQQYNSDGGKVLKLTLNNNSIQNFQINSVIDIIDEKSIYGRDLNQFLQYSEETNDLDVLSEEDTIKQAILILVTLRKNDNKDFLNHGLQASLIIGQNRALLNFPVMNRQLQETFANDDSLKNFNIQKLYFDQDNLFIDFEISTRKGEVMQLTTQI